MRHGIRIILIISCKNSRSPVSSRSFDVAKKWHIQHVRLRSSVSADLLKISEREEQSFITTNVVESNIAKPFLTQLSMLVETL
jgi:hypothetical protein